MPLPSLTPVKQMVAYETALEKGGPLQTCIAFAAGLGSPHSALLLSDNSLAEIDYNSPLVPKNKNWSHSHATTRSGPGLGEIDRWGFRCTGCLAGARRGFSAGFCARSR